MDFKNPGCLLFEKKLVHANRCAWWNLAIMTSINTPDEELCNKFLKKLDANESLDI